MLAIKRREAPAFTPSQARSMSAARWIWNGVRHCSRGHPRDGFPSSFRCRRTALRTRQRKYLSRGIKMALAASALPSGIQSR